jgi:hypothetical protein
MATYTSIQLLPATRERLAHLKAGRETYDELLNKLLFLVPEGDEEGRYTNDFRLGLLNSLVEVKTGRTVKHDEVKKRLGL